MRDLRFLLKARYSNSRGLVIGINEYKGASPLSYAVSDAGAIKDVLVNELHFPKDNVVYLTDSDATRENILRSFLEFSSDNVDLDERIFIFFAGHGHTRTGIKGEVGFLIPHDGDIRDCSTLIRWDDLTRNSELIRAKHMLFIMDACYGGLALVRGLGPGSARFLKDMMCRYSRQVLTAGKADEVVADSGGPVPGHSVFTGHLIQALEGDAVNEQGVITANGLMAYVQNKVAHDNNSNQTPHYGYFDGDGDFIISAPELFERKDEDDRKNLDQLIVVPLVEETHPTSSTQAKLSAVKRLLADESSAIELHDLMINEVKHFLSETSGDQFKVQGAWSREELLGRMARYEAVTSDLCALIACLSYWGKQSHRQILQKVLARSTDRLESQSGLTVWVNLRWYPLILEMYCAGIAAVEGQRYDLLRDVLYTRVGSSRYGDATEQYFVDSVVRANLELTRAEVFKQIPSHEKYYTPLSEYLFKLLQPRFDDILFVGKNYESAFDEFEILLALVVAYNSVQNKRHLWGPIGRFGWKHQGGNEKPLARLVHMARVEGESWLPLRSGLFPGGNSARFLEVADAYLEEIGKLQWW